jgi:hypothetical protein
MKKDEKNFIAITAIVPIVVALNLAIFGYIGPQLVSAKDSFVVFLGVTGVLLAIWIQVVGLLIWLKRNGEDK